MASSLWQTLQESAPAGRIGGRRVWNEQNGSGIQECGHFGGCRVASPTGPPGAALGLQRWEVLLTNYSECSGFSRMYQEMVSSLWQTLQESAPAERIGVRKGRRKGRGVVLVVAG